MWAWVRLAIVGGVVAGAMVAGQQQAGRAGAVAGSVAAMAFVSWLGLLLPRAAHHHFRAGNVRAAGRRYRLLRAVTIDPERRGAIDVSLAACSLAGDDIIGARTTLARVDRKRVGEATRSALLNNLAYASLCSGGDGYAALALADEAIALRPHVAGFHHTRAAALLALNRLDEAIRILDDLWRDIAGDDDSAILEAERCYDLGRAWQRKGHTDYARDYFERARRAAPTSSWSVRATAELPPPQAISASAATVAAGPSPE